MSDFTVRFKLSPIAKLLGDRGRMERALNSQLAIAAASSGAFLAREMRQTIQGGVPPPQAQMTKEIKRSSKTLVDEGRMWKAITHSVVSKGKRPEKILVGVMRSNPRGNVAAIVHRGAKVVVTRRMAMLFAMLAAASVGKLAFPSSRRANELRRKAEGGALFRPLREGSTIVIPPRPFAMLTLSRPTVQATIQKRFADAVHRAVTMAKR